MASAESNTAAPLSATLSTSSSSATTFLDLPPEIRQRIYDYAMPKRVDIDWSNGPLDDRRRSGLVPLPALPFVNKQIVSETGYQLFFQTEYHYKEYMGCTLETRLNSALDRAHRLWLRFAGDGAPPRPVYHGMVDTWENFDLSEVESAQET